MTVAQAIDRALRLLGVVDPDETTSTSDRATGLIALNAMLKTWATSIQGVYRISRETFSITSGTGTYTIGSGADFDTTRPNEVISAFIADGDQDYPLNIRSLDWYDKITDKTVTGLPYDLFYDPQYANGQINLHPVPSKNYTLHLNSIKPFTEYSLTTESLGLPPEIEAAIPHNLAVELAPEYQRNNIPMVMMQAREKLQAAKRLHIHPVAQTNTDVINTSPNRFQIERGF